MVKYFENVVDCDRIDQRKPFCGKAKCYLTLNDIAAKLGNTPMNASSEICDLMIKKTEVSACGSSWPPFVMRIFQLS